MPSEQWVEKAREWLAGWLIDKYRLLEILDGESGAKMVASLAALLDEVERETNAETPDKAIRAALDAVVLRTRERDEAREQLTCIDIWLRRREPVTHESATLRSVQEEMARVERERDEARAEVERLREELARYADRISIWQEVKR